MLKIKIVFFFWMIIEGCFGQKIHSHNDYLQSRPFWEAFESGAASIEIDVFLIKGKLVVAHTVNETDEEKTLKKLYLEPLCQVLPLAKNRDLQILVDFKTEYSTTLGVFIAELDSFKTLKSSNIKFVISGKRPPINSYQNYPSFIYFDHQSMADIGEVVNPKIALVSFSFLSLSKWKGQIPMPIEDKNKIKQIIEEVHALGYPIRFWATPDTSLSWQTFKELGVDFINTDKPRTCKGFFEQPKD